MYYIERMYPEPNRPSTWASYSTEALDRLRERFRPDHDEDRAGSRHRILTAISTMDFRPECRAKEARSMRSADDRDILDALFQVKAERHCIDTTERRLIEMAKRRGVTWPYIALALDVGTPQAAQQRYKRLVTSTSPDDKLLDPELNVDNL